MRPLLVLLLGGALAHRLDPGLLSLRVEGPEVTADWTAPPESPDLLPVLPAGCTPRQPAPGARRLVARCAPTLQGAVTVEGLATARAQVVVRVETAAGVETATLHRDAPSLHVRPEAPVPGRLAALEAYGRLGVPHVLGGLDHVLFVLGLVLLVRRPRDLLLTLTTFTLAHSLALALAATGRVRLPAGPVEACIALSILVLATELAHDRPTLARRHPWLAAGLPGLVHGLGFAGVLGAVGLPAARAPEALLGFNLGVELGQLLVVAAALPLVLLLRRGPAWLQRLPVLALGAVGVAWTLDRVAAILAP